MSIKIIDTQFVKEIYNEDEMISYYTDIAHKIGLFKCEKILFEKYLNLKDKILDIGCGAGRTTIPIYNMGCRDIIGLDIAEEMIKSAKALCNNIDFVIGDATNIQYNSRTFDKVIFSFNGIMLIPRIESRLKALKEISRVLKDDGYFIFSTPYMDNKVQSDFWTSEKRKWEQGNYDSRLHEFGDLLMDDLDIKDIFIHIPKISEVKKCLNEAGFEVVECVQRLDICLEEENIEEQLDDGLFWIAKKISKV
ncbi:MAG: class I SAM-dependent methyltransferase [Clostridium sp.]